jgi:endonuclease YncB( thermonuclease family)
LNRERGVTFVRIFGQTAHVVDALLVEKYAASGACFHRAPRAALDSDPARRIISVHAAPPGRPSKTSSEPDDHAMRGAGAGDIMPKLTSVSSIGRWILLCVFLSAVAAGCGPRQPDWYTPSYPGARLVALEDIEFDDGDTFDLNGEPIRVLGIDTPEIAHPELGMLEDQPYGVEASDSTRAWMTRALTIEVVLAGRDRYNRRLAHVFVNGELLACELIRHALAYETVSHYGDNGFPDLAQEILDTARTSPKPDFEQPYKWKRRQRKKNAK